jgi:nucleoside-diphosphate-sugar epimerase
MKKKTILIAGGTGFIGYHLAKKCVQKNWKVTSISKNKPKKKRYLKKVKYIIGDVSELNFVKKTIVKNYNYVVNLSGYVDHSSKKSKEKIIFKSHYIGCKNIVKVLLKKKIESFVQIGTGNEYGNSSSPQSEEMSCNPKTAYAKAKLLSTKYLINCFKEKNFPATILRIYQVYGPKQDQNRFIPIIIEGCRKNNNFPCSKGDQSRDFLFVSDAVDAIIKSLTIKNSNGNIINIGQGKADKIKKIIILIKNIFKKGSPIFGAIKMRSDELKTIYPNIKKAKKILGWTPKVPLKNGIKKSIK